MGGGGGVSARARGARGDAARRAIWLCIVFARRVDVRSTLSLEAQSSGTVPSAVGGRRVAAPAPGVPDCAIISLSACPRSVPFLTAS